MSIEEENKAVLRSILEEIWNKGDLSRVNELMGVNHEYHATGGREFRGLEGLEPMVKMYRSAFPDYHVTIEDMIAEGDKVVCRYTEQGTHKGNLMDIPPTGKQYKMTGVIISRFAGGKEVEVWSYGDSHTLYQQLGVTPPTQ
jgi:steroid delta-isomerase-like uncharacterized protein